MKIIKLISAGAIWGKAWPILIAIVFFGIIIFIHEAGHFFFAKLFKVKVNEFAMGMGPALLKKKRGDTLYALRLFPIGGYCAMEGENGESEEKGAFCTASAWKRLIIVMAGGVINILFGVLLIGIMNCTSDLVGTTKIHSFYDTSVSNTQGLEAGDEIIKINGKRVFSDYDMSFLMSRSKDGVISFQVKRNGKKVNVDNVKLETTYNEESGKNVIIQDFIIIGESPNFINVISTSFKETASFARMVWLSLFDLVTGQYGLSDLSGPVGTVKFVSDAAAEAKTSLDFSYLFAIMALITINLGVFNLLPVPALDGGRAFFILIEMILRRPVSRKYEGWIHAAGMILLLLFMAVVSFSDIWKLFH